MASRKKSAKIPHLSPFAGPLFLLQLNVLLMLFKIFKDP